MKKRFLGIRSLSILAALIAGFATAPSDVAVGGGTWPHKFYFIVDSARDGVAEISIVYLDYSPVELITDVYLQTSNGPRIKYCTTTTGKCTLQGLVDGKSYTLSADNSLESPRFYAKPLVTHTTYKNSGEITLVQTGLFTLETFTGQWSPKPTFSYKWLKNGQEIPEETQKTLFLDQEDFGSSFQVKVSTKFSVYEDQERLSPVIIQNTPTLPCLANADTSIWMNTSGQPKITGKPVIGETLKSSSGNWGKDAKLCGYWFSNGKSLGKPGALAYSAKSSDAGQYLQYVVVGTLKNGSKILRFSEPIYILKKSFASPKAPSLSGTLSLGSKLTGVVPIWEAGTTFTYKWLRNATAIDTATKSTYVLTEQDLGSKIVFQVCASKKDYETKCLSSPLKSIPRGQIKPVPKVTLSSSTSKVGDTISINTGSWPSGVTIAITWQRDSMPISQEIGTSYMISASDRGHTLSVSVTGSKIGYLNAVVPVSIGKIP